MDITATLVSCLLAISFAMATENGNLTTMLITTTPGLNLTTAVTSSNSTVNATVISNTTENTTPFTSTTQGNETLNETTSHTQTSQPTTMTPLTNSTSLTRTPGTHTPAFTALTTPAIKTTASYKTTLITTANSSHTVNTTSTSEDRATQGLGLNISEKNMTIVFSVILGLFTVALVALMFHRCKHKIQYLHQPLNNTSETGGFEADDDTLVISGGLYDGHPIYDNIPTAPEDQTQFRLEFL